MRNSSRKFKIFFFYAKTFWYKSKFTYLCRTGTKKDIIMTNIAIFASGTGTNAENIIKFFNNSDIIRIGAVFSNSSSAGVINKVKQLGINCHIFTKEELNNPNKVLKWLVDMNIDYIILAGFLLLIPKEIVKQFKGKIINIHPALLPKYSGKGMYGMNVHKAVKEANEPETGITIHIVDEQYDKGDMLFQAKCQIDSNDSAEDIAAKVHKLEYKFFPKIIEEYITKER